MHEVYLESSAERDLRRLAPGYFRRVIPSIRALAKNPSPPGSRKIVGSINDWRIRVGDYRVIYEIDDKKRTVRVMRVSHRRDVYR